MLAILFGVTTLILCFIYFNGKYSERFWKKRGVTFHKKNKVLGIFWDYLTNDQAFFEQWHKVYKAYPNEPAVGIGSFLKPTLYVRDPKNIQHVLVSNFFAFNHRGIQANEDDVLANNILLINGKKWQLMRQSMTPLFTATKLKSMYYIIDKSAQDFVTYLKENPKLTKGNTFNNLSTFCSAAVCAAVFGVTTDSIFDSPFLKVAQDAFQPNFWLNIKFTIASLSFTLFKLLNIQFFKNFEPFFVGAIKQVVRQRETENVKKHDFADICVSLQKKGVLKDLNSGFELKPTDELLAAQAFFFFSAGVEPTAFTMFGALVELGRHPEILRRLHEEIDENFKKSNGNLSYDIILGMNYLDMVTSEAMRIYPPVGYLTRMCTQDTVLPTGNINIAKNTKVITPIYELHHDPKYYPEPEVFKPERFSKENRHKILDITYQPFGAGNRICIGIRYAQLQAKAGLAHLLRHFTVKTNELSGRKKYKKDVVFVRLNNVDVELLPRL